MQDSLPSHGSPTPFSSGYGFVVLAFRPPFGAHESPNDVYNKGELLKRRGICFLLAAIMSFSTRFLPLRSLRARTWCISTLLVSPQIAHPAVNASYALMARHRICFNGLGMCFISVVGSQFTAKGWTSGIGM